MRTPDAALFARQVALSGEAFAGGHFGAAYHALMAAQHLAEDGDDVTGMALVADTAVAQLAWIDSHAPEYAHSTACAQSRGNEGVWTVLVRRVEARLSFLQRQPQGRETTEKAGR